MKIERFVFISLTFIIFLSAIASAEIALTQDIITEKIHANLDNVNLSEAPSSLRFVLGSPKATIKINMDNGDVLNYSFTIEGDVVEGFTVGNIEDANYIIYMDEKSVVDMIESEKDGSTNALLEMLYMDDDITIEPQTLGSKIKYSIASILFNWFG